MTEIAYFSTAFFATTFGVVIFRRLARDSKFIDIPNERSSHVNPTLRGGGIVIVLVCLSLYLIAATSLGFQFSLPYLAGAVLISVVSMIDDHRSLSVPVRLSVHLTAASILVFSADPLPGIYFPFLGTAVILGPAASVIGVLWVVWMINAYNFMDGIDGIAGAQAVASGACWAVFGYIFSIPVYSYLGGILLFSALGFLVHNWRPASVFMGDVGSAFLGYTFAAMPFIENNASRQARTYLWLASLAFLWMFVADSVYTFIRRSLQGQKVWQAHRQHVYQRLLLKGYGHDKVALIYGVAALVIGTSIIFGSFIHIFTEWIPIAAAIAIPLALAIWAERKKV